MIFHRRQRPVDSLLDLLSSLLFCQGFGNRVLFLRNPYFRREQDNLTQPRCEEICPSLYLASLANTAIAPYSRYLFRWQATSKLSADDESRALSRTSLIFALCAERSLALPTCKVESEVALISQVTPHLRSGRRPAVLGILHFLFAKMKYLCAAAALAASLATAQAGGAVELSEDNFNAEITGKNGFIKFLAPVSPHLFCVGSRARA